MEVLPAEGRKLQIPNSKSQTNSKFQIQNSKPDLESGARAQHESTTAQRHEVTFKG